MIDRGRIGIGVITCNRIDLFRKCISSIPEADYIIVVNDGIPYSASDYPHGIKNVIQNDKNLGVGKSKNKALKYLLSNNCDHIFICEDDIQIQDDNIFDHYIRASRISGIQHLNYGYHGPANKFPDGKPKPRKILEYNNVKLALNRNIVGAFSYYSKYSLNQAGFIDERFRNAWEHVDHTYQIIKLNMHPPYWWFADVANSNELILDLDQNISLSTIRNNIFWKLNLKYNSYLFKLKNGYYPTSVPDTSENDLMIILDEIKNNFYRVK